MASRQQGFVNFFVTISCVITVDHTFKWSLRGLRVPVAEKIRACSIQDNFFHINVLIMQSRSSSTAEIARDVDVAVHT